MKKVENIIPCTTNHVCIFSDGKQYEVIGWAVKAGDQTKKVGGDIERVSNMSAIIAINGDVRLADEMNGFVEYKNTDQVKSDKLTDNLLAEV